MVKIHTLPLGSYQTNCYIVYEEGSSTCALIDPGANAAFIQQKLAELGLKPDAILLTHGHFDHVGAVKTLVEDTGCALWMREGDYTQKNTPENRMFYPIHDCTFTEVQFCEEGEVIQAGGVTFTALETPGHTWGSVCYRCGSALFTGDTLFAGSCGRTDLPGGDWDTIHASLKRLAELEEDLTVYPGHGPRSTLAYERNWNPYMK